MRHPIKALIHKAQTIEHQGLDRLAHRYNALFAILRDHAINCLAYAQLIEDPRHPPQMVQITAPIARIHHGSGFNVGRHHYLIADKHGG